VSHRWIEMGGAVSAGSVRMRSPLDGRVFEITELDTRHTHRRR
jgi:hypothetical protein